MAYKQNHRLSAANPSQAFSSPSNSTTESNKSIITECHPPRPLKRMRRIWSSEREAKFNEAVEELGGLERTTCTPTNILTLMQDPGLKYEQVNSHLQAVRKNLRRDQKSIDDSDHGSSISNTNSSSYDQLQDVDYWPSADELLEHLQQLIKEVEERKKGSPMVAIYTPLPDFLPTPGCIGLQTIKEVDENDHGTSISNTNSSSYDQFQDVDYWPSADELLEHVEQRIKEVDERKKGSPMVAMYTPLPDFLPTPGCIGLQTIKEVDENDHGTSISNTISSSYDQFQDVDYWPSADELLEHLEQGIKEVDERNKGSPMVAIYTPLPDFLPTPGSTCTHQICSFMHAMHEYPASAKVHDVSTQYYDPHASINWPHY